MTTGPEYYAAAAKHLAAAEDLEANRPLRLAYADRDRAALTRHMDLFKANADMARLALDAAKAVAGGETTNATEIYSEAVQARTDALHANHLAWIAAITEGGA